MVKTIHKTYDIPNRGLSSYVSMARNFFFLLFFSVFQIVKTEPILILERKKCNRKYRNIRDVSFKQDFFRVQISLWFRVWSMYICLNSSISFYPSLSSVEFEELSNHLVTMLLSPRPTFQVTLFHGVLSCLDFDVLRSREWGDTQAPFLYFLEEKRTCS